MELTSYMYPAGGSKVELTSLQVPSPEVPYGTNKSSLPGRRFFYRTGKYDISDSICDLSVLTDVMCKMKHGL